MVKENKVLKVTNPIKLEHQEVTIVKQANTIDEVYEVIEEAGRICYQSQDKIEAGSAKEFVERLKEKKHLSVLEHGTIYLTFQPHTLKANCDNWVLLLDNPYSSCTEFEDTVFITTNLRVLVENELLPLLEYFTPPTKSHDLRVTFKLKTNRAIANEIVRHRKFSFSQESTRYCNYSKTSRFGTSMKFIAPTSNLIEGYYASARRSQIIDDADINSIDDIMENVILFSEYKDDFNAINKHNIIKMENKFIEFIQAMENSQKAYRELTRIGMTAQEARDVLPLGLSTEMYMTGFMNDWEHFFELRTPKNAHPQARQIASMIQELMSLQYGECVDRWEQYQHDKKMEEVKEELAEDLEDIDGVQSVNWDEDVLTIEPAYVKGDNMQSVIQVIKKFGFEKNAKLKVFTQKGDQPTSVYAIDMLPDMFFSTKTHLNFIDECYTYSELMDELVKGINNNEINDKLLTAAIQMGMINIDSTYHTATDKIYPEKTYIFDTFDFYWKVIVEIDLSSNTQEEEDEEEYEEEEMSDIEKEIMTIINKFINSLSK